MPTATDPKPTVVITTIGAPTSTIAKLCDDVGAPLVVIGDNKTPAAWAYEGADYYSVERQREVFPDVADALPYNHYCRKNLGYLIAARAGAASILDTDDDNIPKDNWHAPPAEGTFETAPAEQGYVNVYSAFTGQHIWPRGLPLSDILRPGANLAGRSFETRRAKVGVWQGLADGDPDVDAIYRLTVNKPCEFDARPPLVLGAGTLCPYNSQNTLTFREFFPLLYLPCHVTFRFTDILRGLIGQVLLWNAGARLGFFEATVFQDRNAHDFFKDFVDEIPCYLHPVEVTDEVGAAADAKAPLPDQLVQAYEALVRKDICRPAEIPILETWLKALEAA